MRTDKLTLGFSYLRLSNEEALGGESSSITNQRMSVQNYCKREKIEARIGTIDKIVTKLYTDNAAGDLDDDRLRRMVADLEKESVGLQATLDSLTISRSAEEIESGYASFFPLAREYTQIQELDRETLMTFVERIGVGPKKYPDGTVKATHRNQPYRQSIRIVYKFIGEVAEEPVRALSPMAGNKANDTPAGVVRKIVSPLESQAYLLKISNTGK